MENNKIIDGNCWLAYFDILGFSNMVESFPVEFVRDKFKEALKEVEQFNAICRFKFFSDSFIFYTENVSPYSFQCIRGASAFFFRAMFTRKKLPHFPMRGCLNVGKFYADEENGIFFGRALIDAYHCAEGQNWIGFVLSDEARRKFEDYESKGFKSSKYSSFHEYDVPYKKEAKRRNLLAYRPYSGSPNYPERWWEALSNMRNEAFLALPDEKENENIDTCSKCKRIFTKYRNTENYLLFLYPSLQSEVRIEQDEPCAGCRKKKGNYGLEKY
ncbi:MAG: hypothetical protein CEE38_01450 [Planctomycetes bacterium B3_Pla]|nr:MAG: hypothetical protein CEE38_01450 [Planctomycetes bacterium B3_Pla]